MDVHKVAGVANAADLVTKHLGPGKAKDHLEAIGVRIEDGRATSAPTLSSLSRALRGQGVGKERQASCAKSLALDFPEPSKRISDIAASAF